MSLAQDIPPPRLGVYLHALEPEDWDDFRELCHELRRSGYRFVGSPEEYLAAQDKCAWLSFDDNYRSWFESKGLLEELDLKATFFINTVPLRDVADDSTIEAYYDRIDFHGDHTPLSSDEISELAESGHTIGAHTHTHRNLAILEPDQQRWEIETNRRQLEEIVGRPIVHFAFPFGLPRYFPEPLRGWCLEHGIETISFATPGMQYEPTRRQSLQRTPWRFDRGFQANWEDLRVDGRWFVRTTGKSPVG